MKRLSVLFLAIILLLPATALGNVELDTLQASLLTADPGPEIFELYGHEAIRIQGRRGGRNVDIVFNYGVFDFYAPGFIYRFVKGETDYLCAAQPTALFLFAYNEAGRQVRQQRLNISTPQAERLLRILSNDATPDHRTYRYKYFSRNCASRPMERLRQALGDSLRFRDRSKTAATPLRGTLLQYNDRYPWYQFAIDLVLNVEALPQPTYDFVPLDLEKALRQSSVETTGGGEALIPLVAEEEVLVVGEGDQREAATPWLLSPLPVCWAWLIFVAAMVITGYIKGWRLRWLRCFWYVLLGTAGIVVTFLTLFSEHEGTSANTLVWWLNPLWLPAAIWVCLPGRPRLRVIYVALLALAPLTLLVLKCAGAISQYYNPAVIPLMVATLLLASKELGMRNEE